jgi:hypothetical protein
MPPEAEVSYPTATQQEQHDSREGYCDAPSAAEGVSTVSASALALHLDCSRAYIGDVVVG